MREPMESRKEQKRQSLLDAAYALFTEKGVAKTSVDEIVRGANVAKGTFYLYFHDKDQLLGQLVYNISAQVLEEAYEWLDERRTPDFVENVLLLLDYVVEYFKRNKLVLRLVERNFSWPMVAKQMSERRGPLWARLMRDLEASPLAARYTEDELFKMIFVIIEMLGSVCYSSIIEGKAGHRGQYETGAVRHRPQDPELKEAQKERPPAGGLSRMKKMVSQQYMLLACI